MLQAKLAASGMKDILNRPEIGGELGKVEGDTRDQRGRAHGVHRV